MQAQGITLGVLVFENGGHQGCFSGVDSMDSHGGVNEVDKGEVGCGGGECFAGGRMM